MNVTVIVQPPFEPVTLQQCYTQLRIDPSGSPLEHPDDAMILGFIKTARETIEGLTNRSLVKQVLRLSTSCFPRCGGIRLLRPPILRVEAVRYYDGENAAVELDRSDWYVTDEQIPELRFGSGFGAPSHYTRPDALSIEYVAGYPPSGSPEATFDDYTSAVPQSFKDAILLEVQLLYDQLAPDQRTAIERTRDALISVKRILTV